MQSDTNGPSRREGEITRISNSTMRERQDSLRGIVTFSGSAYRAAYGKLSMTMRVVLALLLTVACAWPIWSPTDSIARNSGSSHSSGGHSSGHHASKNRSHTKADPGVRRDSHGHIKRSGAAKNAFKKSHPCPSTGKSSGACPGYVIDHVQPLKRGGKDSPENMQWQTKEAAKAKDKLE